MQVPSGYKVSTESSQGKLYEVKTITNTYTPEPNKPEAKKPVSKAVKTGDATSILLYEMLLAGSGLALVLARKRTKNR